MEYGHPDPGIDDPFEIQSSHLHSQLINALQKILYMRSMS